MSFLCSHSDLYSASVTAVMYAISCHIRLRVMTPVYVNHQWLNCRSILSLRSVPYWYTYVFSLGVIYWWTSLVRGRSPRGVLSVSFTRMFVTASPSVAINANSMQHKIMICEDVSGGSVLLYKSELPVTTQLARILFSHWFLAISPQWSIVILRYNRSNRRLVFSLSGWILGCL